MITLIQSHSLKDTRWLFAIMPETVFTGTLTKRIELRTGLFIRITRRAIPHEAVCVHLAGTCNGGVPIQGPITLFDDFLVADYREASSRIGPLENQVADLEEKLDALMAYHEVESQQLAAKIVVVRRGSREQR